MGINSAPKLAVLLSLLFKILCPSAVEKNICSLAHFGLPDLDACNSLLFGSTTGRPRGIHIIDGADHAFIFSDFAKASDFTEEQWKHKVYYLTCLRIVSHSDPDVRAPKV